MQPEDLSESDVAIVGMAGRFPGAPDVDMLWQRVRDGEDCLVDLDPGELIAAGLPASLVQAPDYVRRAGVLEGVDQFDPGFFGIGKRDAAIMDPQHRHLLECVWEALESAGYVPERFPGAIGVFAGCGVNTYLINNLLSNPQLVDQVGWFLLRHTGNDKDFLSTGISYRLDLRGPSINVQTACSTSLVATHLAVQSLLAFECDLALAGGATIDIPTARGYRYHEGEVLSPDGFCRAFDARSGGTVLTPGAGVIALRRLTDAYRDGDPILAVIKGSAVNNDGARKVGFFAPSVDGHADVVKEALAVAGLTGRDIQLLEAHGTGTAVGDPIEVAALSEAFNTSAGDGGGGTDGEAGGATGYCRLVSTKPNIGHLDTAAGVASIIKVVQALRHQTLPPLANHTEPSPLIDFASTPFVLSAEASPWPGDVPRRAGVSSLGVGGTNAHVILEEAPSYEPTPAAVPEQVLALSGRSAKAVDDAAERLASFLEANPHTNLADVAHTLAVGRRALEHRRVVTATDLTDAVAQLRTPERRRSARGHAPDTAPGVAFMFPGGGSQYPGMAAGLDERFDVFHATMRDGLDQVRAITGIDLAPLLRRDGDEVALRDPSRMLPAVFLTSVALARQWMAWGVMPRALIGHSLGEYTAAHLAGVMSLDVAIRLIDVRSRLIERVAGANAAMMLVPLPEGDVVPRLPAGLSLATVNAHDECVVSGDATAARALADELASEDVECTVVPVAAAGHSALLDPILPDFLDAVRQMRLDAPAMPWLSNLTGTWISPDEVTKPQYWVDHLRHTVRFADGLATVLADGPLVLAEVGPGHALSSAARRQAIDPVAVIPALRHPKDDIDDTAHALQAFAKLWASGVPVDLDQLTGDGRRRLRLPTYPFQRERFWIDAGAGRASTESFGAAFDRAGSDATASTAPRPPAGPSRIPDLDDWFWEPSWLERALDAPVTSSVAVGPWLLVGDHGDSLVEALAAELRKRGEMVRIAVEFDPERYAPARAVAVVGGTGRDVLDLDRVAPRWLGDAVRAARALGGDPEGATHLALITRGATAASGAAIRPVDALAFGVALVAPHEYPDLRTVLIDLEAEAGADAAVAVVDELLAGHDRVVARRAARRLVPAREHRKTPAAAAASSDAVAFRHGGTYLVTGGLGGIGFVLASHLARTYQANLVVVSSEPIPEGDERERWVTRHSDDDPTSRRIRRVLDLEALGTKVAVIAADLADPTAVRTALDDAERRVGRLDGAIHAAGVVRDRLIALVTPEDHEAVVGPKARAAVVLADELERRGAELLVLISSTSTELAPSGQTSYVAANAVLDALAGTRGKLRVVTLDYGVWAGTGKAAEMARRLRLGIEEGEPVAHPVLADIRVDRAGNIELVGRLDAGHDWVVDEHRVESGVAVLPGTAHLDLLLSSLRLAGLDQAGLRDVSVLAPLVVPDDRPVTVRVTITRADPKGVRLARIESDGGGGRAWQVHTEAELALDATERSVQPLDLDAIAARCGLDGADPLASPRRHAQLGPRWDAVRDARLGDGETYGVLSLPDSFADDVEVWTAHPALVDVATAFGVLLGHADDERVLYVPVGYQAVTSFAPVPADVAVHAVRQPASTDEMLLVDFAMTDRAGNVVLSVDGLSLRPVREPGKFAALPDDLTADDASSRAVAPLLALAERAGIRDTEGPELLERLLASGRRRLIATSVDLAELVEPGDASARDEQGAGDAAAGSAGAGTVVDVLTAIWRDLLGVADIGPDDDFFDLGGHSLIAIRIMARIHRELGVRFQLATLFEAPTVAKLAELVKAERPDIEATMAAAAAPASTAAAAAATSASAGHSSGAATGRAAAARNTTTQSCLVPIRPAGTKEPFFIVHGAGGNVLYLWSLARALPESRPVYGFQAHGLDGQDDPDPTIEAMASRYVTALREFKPGPYLLGGYSGGGIVALEMVNQLQALGEDVAYLVLFDSIPPEHVYPANGSQVRHVLGNLRKQGVKPVWPYLDEWARRSFRRVVPSPAERHEARLRQATEMGYLDVSEFGFVNLEEYFASIVRRHTLTTYHVDTLLLKADEVWPIHRDDYYWSPHITGHLDIRTVPGNHNTMFAPEHAPRLADTLVPLLDAHEPERRTPR